MQPRSKDPNTNFPLDSIEFGSVTNEQLVVLGNTAPVLYGLGPTTIVRLSRQLIMKFGPAIREDEISVTKRVLADTNIRTPTLHRSFLHHSGGYMVMDYIDGSTLETIWDGINEASRDAIGREIAEMVSSLQTIRFSEPGTLSGGSSRGVWFSEYEPEPFKGTEDFNNFFNRKLAVSMRFGQAKLDLPPFCFDSFCLVHQDLKPINFILDGHGKLWIIDWGSAGAYPPVFEAAALSADTLFKDFDELVLKYIPHKTEEVEHLKAVVWALQNAPLA
jgi:serine/threonine protein kinase